LKLLSFELKTRVLLRRFKNQEEVESLGF